MKVTVESTSEEDGDEGEEAEQRAASQGSLAAGSRCMIVGDVGSWSGLNCLIANVRFIFECANGQQVELKECRLMLAEERRARLTAESKLMEVNFVLFKADLVFICLSFIFCFLQLARIGAKTPDTSIVSYFRCNNLLLSY